MPYSLKPINLKPSHPSLSTSHSHPHIVKMEESLAPFSSPGERKQAHSKRASRTLLVPRVWAWVGLGRQ